MPVASAITRVFSWRAAVAAIAAVTGVVPIVATTGHSAAQDSGSRAAVANGRALVERSKCLDCHRIGDRGSRLGPTLTDIGNLRSREELRDALVAPDQDVLPEHRSVRLVTKDGATIVGRLLNQDAFSIQLMNADEQLKSYARSNLREHTIVTKGLMPSYEGKLTSQEIADVVNYLASLPEGEDLDAAPNPTPALDRVLHAEREPQNWLTYGGSYSSQRYSLLDQIKPENVGRLTLKWVWRPKYLDKMETTPLVVDGVLYAVQNSEVVALDAATGRSFWTFRYRVPPESNAYLMVVKGLAISGDRLFWATLRRAPDCDRREDRQVDLEQDARRLEEGPSVQCRAARRQGQSHPRAGDERIRRQLLDRRVRRPHRKAGLEIQYRRRSPASPATIRGRATRGSTAARRSG